LLSFLLTGYRRIDTVLLNHFLQSSSCFALSSAFSQLIEFPLSFLLSGKLSHVSFIHRQQGAVLLSEVGVDRENGIGE